MSDTILIAKTLLQRSGFAMLCLALAAILLLGSPGVSFAQKDINTGRQDTGIAPGEDLETALIPLDSIIMIALQNSPTLKYQEALVRQNESQVHFVRRAWQNNIIGYANVSQGNQSVLLSGSSNPDVVQNQSLANGYRIGVNVNIPLYEFSGRKHRIRLYEEQLNAARHKGDEMEMEVYREVVAAYYDLIAAQDILRIRANARESAALHLMMAEKQFQQGSVAVAEYARVSEIAAKAEAEFELARKEYNTSHLYFERLVGVDFKELIRKK